MSNETVLDYRYYRRQAFGYQKQLRACEEKIAVIWDAALLATQGDDRAAAYIVLFDENTQHGFEFASLKGERSLLLQQIQAAAAMSTMLYVQDRGES